MRRVRVARLDWPDETIMWIGSLRVKGSASSMTAEPGEKAMMSGRFLSKKDEILYGHGGWISLYTD